MFSVQAIEMANIDQLCKKLCKLCKKKWLKVPI